MRYILLNTSNHDIFILFLPIYLIPQGLLVDAMRKGYWIILDELNLAPTDVLEALNRVRMHFLINFFQLIQYLMMILFH